MICQITFCHGRLDFQEMTGLHPFQAQRPHMNKRCCRISSVALHVTQSPSCMSKFCPRAADPRANAKWPCKTNETMERGNRMSHSRNERL